MRALLFRIRRAFSSSNFIIRYLNSRGFRVSASLLLSLVLNLLYLTFNLVSGIVYSSTAFIAVALYYALHIRIRYTILELSYTAKDKRSASLAARRGGVLLLIADALITPMLIFGVTGRRRESYSPFVFVFLSAFSVYTLISAAAGIFVSKKEQLTIYRAAYSVRLASGIVSGFNLVSAIIPSFVDGESAAVFTAALGSVVSFSVLVLSLSMVFSSVNTERSL